MIYLCVMKWLLQKDSLIHHLIHTYHWEGSEEHSKSTLSHFQVYDINCSHNAIYNPITYSPDNWKCALFDQHLPNQPLSTTILLFLWVQGDTFQVPCSLDLAFYGTQTVTGMYVVPPIKEKCFHKHFSLYTKYISCRYQENTDTLSNASSMKQKIFP